jgi:hypothetical protein
MTWQIVIDFDDGQVSPTFVHQLRNFGEDLWRACGQDGWASMAIDDIDRATNQLTVTVSSSRRIRRTVNMTRKLLDEHFLAGYARISEVNIGP